MVNLTKKGRYSKETIEAIMENFLELRLTLTEATPDHMLPVYDYERAVERILLTDMERKVFETRYPMDSHSLSGLEVAEELDVDSSYIYRTSANIIYKIANEMNRGLADD